MAPPTQPNSVAVKVNYQRRHKAKILLFILVFVNSQTRFIYLGHGDTLSLILLLGNALTPV